MTAATGGFPLSAQSNHVNGKDSAIPVHPWPDPAVSRRLRLPYFKTIGTWSW